MAALLPATGRWLLRWAVLMGMWVVLTDTHKQPELIAGAVAAAIAATAAALVVRPGPPKSLSKSIELLRLGPSRLLRPLVRLAVDTGLLTLELVRRLAGRGRHGTFRAVRYRPEEARRSAAGRALTEIWGSLAANRVVVGTDEDEGVLMVHELARTDEPLDPLAGR
jgi:hypothetical protein